MSNYITRDELLDAGIVTHEVKFKDKILVVREMPAHAVQKFFDDGVVKIEEGGEVKVEASKMNFIKIASVCLVDKETLKPLMSEEELSELSFNLVQTIAGKAMEITDWGEEELNADNAKKD